MPLSRGEATCQWPVCNPRLRREFCCFAALFRTSMGIIPRVLDALSGGASTFP
jgi:hypothetical protein